MDEPSMLKGDAIVVPGVVPGAGSGKPGAPPPTADATSTHASRPRPASASSGLRAAGADAQVVYVAGFWRRFLAALVDGLAAVPLAALLALLAGKMAGVSFPRARHTGIDYWLDLALAGEPALWGALGLGIAIVSLYLFLFQAGMGRTPGMRLLRLRIIDAYGDAPGLLRAAVRTVGYLVATATFSLGFIWIGFDREKRGLHDWLAGTYVVRTDKGS